MKIFIYPKELKLSSKEVIEKGSKATGDAKTATGYAAGHDYAGVKVDYAEKIGILK